MSLDRAAPALFAFLWSTGWIAAKFGATVSGPLTFLCIRYALAAVLFVGLCRMLDVRWPTDKSAIAHSIVSGALLHGFYLGAVWWAIGQGVPAGLSGIIAALQPLMTAFVAPYLIGERLSASQKAGLAFGFCGVAIAVLPKLFDQNFAQVAGFAVLVNIVGMFSVTYGTIYQKKHLKTGDIRAIATLQYIGALFVTLPFAVVLEPWHVDFNWVFWAVLAWSVLGNSMAAILLLLHLLRHGQASRAAALIYLVPPLAALQAAIAFGEQPTAFMVVGTIIAVLGVYLTNRKTALPPQAVPEQPPAKI